MQGHCTLKEILNVNQSSIKWRSVSPIFVWILINLLDDVFRYNIIICWLSSFELRFTRYQPWSKTNRISISEFNCTGCIKWECFIRTDKFWKISLKVIQNFVSSISLKLLFISRLAEILISCSFSLKYKDCIGNTSNTNILACMFLT